MTQYSFFACFVALVATVANGLIAKVVAGIWLSDDKARIAAFAFVLGSSAAATSLGYDVTAGSLLGLLSLWWLLFREGKATS